MWQLPMKKNNGFETTNYITIFLLQLWHGKVKWFSHLYMNLLFYFFFLLLKFYYTTIVEEIICGSRLYLYIYIYI